MNNPSLVVGAWVVCGCIISLLLYAFDDEREKHKWLYGHKLFLIAVMMVWPYIVYILVRLFLSSIFGRKEGP